MKFSNRTALITGGGQGIGKKIAEILAVNGVSNIVIGDINQNKAQQVASDLMQNFDLNAEGKVINVIEKNDIDKLVSETNTRYGSVDVLVNCAGVLYQRQIKDITENEWDEVMNVNLRGTFFCCQAVTPLMKKKQRGTILNLASIAGKVGGLSSGAHYAVSKAGVICLTKIFARELAPFGVRVNALAPGPVDTAMLTAFPKETREKLSKDCPLGKLADVDDIAEAALFLISDSAKHITGEILDINGGLLMD
jgi:3-oxoacyl-[acyl-carrier protein] reductase